jgi:tetratricopeptide (TPR) repeat protein
LLALAGLVDKSLLRLAASGRYEMHELLRQYGAGKLAEDPLQEMMGRDQHCAHYCAVLKQYEANLKGARQQMALAEIEADRENMRAAWNWAVSQGQVERIEQALESLALFFDWHGYYQEGELACRLAAQKLAPPETEERIRVLIKVLTWQSNFNRELGQSELANQQLRQSLALLDGPMLANRDTRLERAAILLRSGRIALNTDREEAQHLFEQSLHLYRMVGDSWWTAQTLGWLGEVNWEAGRYDQARQLAEESLALRRQLGDQEGIANILSLLGWIALTQGQLEEALRLQQESLTLYRKMGLQVLTAGALRNLGAVFIFLGQFAKALSVLAESLAIFNDLGNRSNLVFANILSGAALLQLGQYEQAQAQLRLGLDLAQTCDDQPGIGYALLWLGRLALNRQAYAEAWQLQHECVTVFRKLGQRDQLSTALASLGLASYNLGHSAEAKRHLAEALQTATEIGAFLPLLFALPLASLLLADQEEPERAVELYALAGRYPFVANSCWMEEMFGRQISAVVATLPPDAGAIAQKRGQSRDLWLTAAEILADCGSGDQVAKPANDVGGAKR